MYGPHQPMETDYVQPLQVSHKVLLSHLEPALVFCKDSMLTNAPINYKPCSKSVMQTARLETLWCIYISPFWAV